MPPPALSILLNNIVGPDLLYPALCLWGLNFRDCINQAFCSPGFHLGWASGRSWWKMRAGREDRTRVFPPLASSLLSHCRLMGSFKQKSRLLSLSSGSAPSSCSFRAEGREWAPIVGAFTIHCWFSLTQPHFRKSSLINLSDWYASFLNPILRVLHWSLVEMPAPSFVHTLILVTPWIIAPVILHCPLHSHVHLLRGLGAPGE